LGGKCLSYIGTEGYPRYTKVDRYVLKLLLGVRGEGRGIPDNDESVRKKYPTKVIQEMVMTYLGVKITEGEVKRLRQVAYDFKRSNTADKDKASLLLALSRS